MPHRTMLVAGAIKLERYDYLALQVVEHVVLRGKDYDPRAGSHEFTNWDALRDGVLDFAATARPRDPAPPA
ncbi:MAG: hypothetical protein ACU0BS_04335 [Hasllibacter sp.]